MSSPSLHFSALLASRHLACTRPRGVQRRAEVFESQRTAAVAQALGGQEQLLTFSFPRRAASRCLLPLSSLWPVSRHQSALLRSWPRRVLTLVPVAGFFQGSFVTNRLTLSICSSYGNFRSSLSKAEHTMKHLKCWWD